MHDTSLFVPETFQKRCEVTWLQAYARLPMHSTAISSTEKFVSANAAAGGRYDDRLNLRIVLDGAAPIIRSNRSTSSTLKVKN